MRLIYNGWLIGSGAFLLACFFSTVPSSGQPSTLPTTRSSTRAADDARDDGLTADNFRSRGDALWGAKHDYVKALATYRRGAERFPTSVRLLVSLSATSIDFGYQHADSDAGREAYKEARAAIDKGLRLIADGTGQDVDAGAKNSLETMSHQVP